CRRGTRSCRSASRRPGWRHAASPRRPGGRASLAGRAASPIGSKCESRSQSEKANAVRISCTLSEVRSGKRADKRRSIETAVLDEATEMIRAGGPGALTMAELAARLGLSVGGLYRYYPAKGAILVGLEKRAIASYDAVQARILETLEPRLRRAPPEV